MTAFPKFLVGLILSEFYETISSCGPVLHEVLVSQSQGWACVFAGSCGNAPVVHFQRAEETGAFLESQVYDAWRE